MKRKYKEGDWIRISLDASYDAIGIIARACRSRLFGYFFAVPAGEMPPHEDLKRLRAQDAVSCALFGGAPLEDARWQIVATSVAFDRDAWPFPHFAMRGAFGRTWTVRTFDPQEMHAVETVPASRERALGLPDARFAGPDELEAHLRERICGTAPAEPLAVYQAGAAIEREGLELLTRGGRVQFDQSLSDEALRMLAAFIAEHPDVELRVHGFAGRIFDLRRLAPFQSLRSLLIDVPAAAESGALRSLRELRRLRIGRMPQPLDLVPLQDLAQLRALEIAGMKADMAGVCACAHLESLTLIDTKSPALASLASAPRLRELVLAHVSPDLAQIGALPSLVRLELRDLPLLGLPDFTQNAALRSITLRNVRRLRDLREIARAPHVRELRIEGMPQLEVPDFEPLAAAGLRNAVIDVGSRRKSREIYRLLHLGKTSA